jgi:tetratricopeptide (TPR) repeat protein
MPRLVVIDGEGKGKTFVVKSGTQVLGRSKGDLVVNDPRISRSHVSISFDGATGKVAFTDLKSLNGTLVNGVRLESGELRDGDKIQLGDTRLDFQMLSADPDITAQKHLEEMLARNRDDKADPGQVAKKKEQSAIDEPLAPPKTGKSQEMGQTPPDAMSEPETTPRQHLRLPRMNRASVVALSILAVGLYLFKNTFLTEKRVNIEERMVSIKQLAENGRMDEALADTIRLSTKYPQHAQVFTLLGTLYERQGKIRLAISSLQTAHALQPTPELHIKMLKLYVEVAAEQGVAEEVAHLDEIIRNGPRDKEVFSQIALLYLDLKDRLKQPPEKSFIIAKALQKELAPNDPVGYKLEALVLSQQEKYQDAIAPLKKAAELAPLDEWPLENLTFAYLKVGDMVSAEETVKEWMRSQSDSMKPYLVMAYLKFNQQNPMEALPYAQKVVELGANKRTDPFFAEALGLIGHIYYKQGQIAEAKSSLMESCGLGYQPGCELKNTVENAQSPPESPRGASSENPEQKITKEEPPTPAISPSPASSP